MADLGEGDSQHLRVQLENAACATRNQHELDGCLLHARGRPSSNQATFCMFPSLDPLRVPSKKSLH